MCCCYLVTKWCPPLATPWTVAHQAPLSMGFPRQEYWSESPFPFPRDLPSPGTEPSCLTLQADSLPLSHLGSQVNQRLELDNLQTITGIGMVFLCSVGE